jgi:hypothetical protein
MEGKSKLSKFQIAGIVVLFLVLLTSLAIIGMKIWQDSVPIAATSTSPAIVKIILPTTTPIARITASPILLLTPTERVKYPTWTPIATATRMKTLAAPSHSVAGSSYGSYSGSTYCAAWLSYYESVHNSNVAYINAFYDPWISYYESEQKQALEQLDGLAMIRIDEQINKVKADRDAALKSENAQYQSQIAYVQLHCR